MVLWISDLCVEAASAGSATDEDVRTLHALAQSLQDSGAAPNAARLLDQLRELGYEEVSQRRFDFQSGALYQYARALGDLASKAWERRQQLLQAHRGKHPPLTHPDWGEWERVVMSMNATVMGGWVLGVAAVEALVNEILSQRFPADYQELESGRRRAGFRLKLERLCDRVGLDQEQEWISHVVQAHSSRSDLVHHKPTYLDETFDRQSVEPSDMHHPRGLTEFLDRVDVAFESLFGAFSLDVPPTHRATG